MKKSALVIVLLFSFSLLAGCVPHNVRPDGSVAMNTGYCALMGAGVGAGAGAATRLKKPGQNMLIGAIIGAIGGIITCKIIEEKSQQAALEAARTNRVVQYRTNDGQTIRATPADYQSSDGCREIVNEAWDTDNTYLGKVTRRVCPGQNGSEIRS